MDRIRKLADELRDEAYAAMDTAEICQALNAKNITVLREAWVNERTLFAVLGDERATQVLDILESLPDSRDKRIYRMLTDIAAQGIDISLPSAYQRITQMVQGGLLSQAEGDALHALAEQKISRAEQLGIGTVTGQDVRAAREVVI